jgi:hypothetical protein
MLDYQLPLATDFNQVHPIQNMNFVVATAIKMKMTPEKLLMP